MNKGKAIYNFVNYGIPVIFTGLTAYNLAVGNKEAAIISTGPLAGYSMHKIGEWRPRLSLSDIFSKKSA